MILANKILFRLWNFLFAHKMEVVVAQLVEQSLPTPEVRGLNPAIGKIYMYYQLNWKDEIKEKEAGNGRIFNKFVSQTNFIFN